MDARRDTGVDGVYYNTNTSADSESNRQPDCPSNLGPGPAATHGSPYPRHFFDSTTVDTERGHCITDSSTNLREPDWVFSK